MFGAHTLSRTPSKTMTFVTQARPKPVIKVLLVDDHPIVRQGIRMLIDQESDLTVCGEAESEAQALKVIEQTQPHVAVVDLSLKGSSGLSLTREIHARYPHIHVLVLSMRDEAFYAERVLRAGAKGYITKEQGSERIIEGIRKVLSGQIYLSDTLASKMLSMLVAGQDKPGESPVGRLTDRELAVFELIGHGLTTRDIAKQLYLSVKTVESHREHIKAKLDLAGAPDLLKHAIQWVQCQDIA